MGHRQNSSFIKVVGLYSKILKANKYATSSLDKSNGREVEASHRCFQSSSHTPAGRFGPLAASAEGRKHKSAYISSTHNEEDASTRTTTATTTKTEKKGWEAAVEKRTELHNNTVTASPTGGICFYGYASTRGTSLFY